MCRLALFLGLGFFTRLSGAELECDDDVECATKSANEVREMFTHAYDAYKRYAFPQDDLRPLSMDGANSFAELGNLALEGLERSTYKGVGLSLIESMTTLAVLGNVSEFRKCVAWLEEHPKLFDQDVRVNVFEAIIRALGALLSSHMLATFSMPELCTWCEAGTDSPLLAMAVDLGSRLFQAFTASPSDIPFAWVNLRSGVDDNETGETNLAGAGTSLLEYSVLSRLTGDNKYERASVACMKSLFKMRSARGLHGTAIDVRTGMFKDRVAGVGFGTDSYYEYLLKSYILLGDPWYWGMFIDAYESTQRFMRSGPWYADVHAISGHRIQEAFTSLQAFFPGLQVAIGDIDAAKASHDAFFGIWNRYGLMPERYMYKTSTVHPTMKYYPLRPELVESTLGLYLATGDTHYQKVVGRSIVDNLNNHSRVETGGFAAVHDVETMEKENHQQSFFLSETLKYLYLLFNNSFLTQPEFDYIFTTEGHPIPLVYDLRSGVFEDEPLPSRYRGWCFGESGDSVDNLGIRCSSLDLRVCPTQFDPSDEDVKRAVHSACHVHDSHNTSKCTRAEDCGVDAETCRERLCSSNTFCFTPD
eukprot:TRINITY_DN28911_c0_g1_i1.p1 TRINITY_DN28911_c0_g1~~TRINITY_DN28911_c0_g1_i1.p1  ORF type:complete len:588 (+),score=77.55 TRINITY_DN28911_c0_g1_i1:71-1834(+)